MPTLGAIDIGSNAMRMAVGFVDAQRRLHVVEDLREAVRLGQDVFTRGVITRPTLERALKALRYFRGVFDQHRVVHFRAVATSALREARNRDVVLRRFQQATGIVVKTITAEEEALLVQTAVAERVDLKGRTALLVDVGGGSVEVTLVKDGRIAATESFNMGAVRLLKMLEGEKADERRFNRMVEEYAESARRRILEKFGGKPVGLCVGTGGNLDELGSLRQQLLGGRDNESFSRTDLERIIRQLKRTPYGARVERLHMRPDRADVILPAALVLEKLLRAAKIKRVLTPHVGLKEGLLRDLADEMETGRPSVHREELLASAIQLGRKFHFDEPHAERVARFAAELFDRTRRLHRLEESDRLLLEVSAWLHDIGQHISYASHHKHSYYLIRSSHLVGLDRAGEDVVANVARYHRKSPPRMKHENFRMLAPPQRQRVTRLASLLRLADSLDYEHAGKVNAFRLETSGRRVTLRMRGEGDLLLEKWSLMRKCDLFNRAFRVRFSVQG